MHKLSFMNADGLRLRLRVMAAVRGRHSCLPGLPFVPVDQPAYSCHPTCLVASGDSSTTEGASQ
ncbi:hypothetical protein E1573_20950 [Pseudomonas sp. H9]|nr:hypothetical protein E1573_20950 [Pseudomonas sp. H9]